MILKGIWSLVVGVKYGFYSDPLLRALRERPIPASFLASEQILTNWSPSLDRLMFELRAAALSGPNDMVAASIMISKKHPVASYHQGCIDVGDAPLCLLPSEQIHLALLKLPINNFHRAFWSRLLPGTFEEGKVYASTDSDEITSYKPFLLPESASGSAKDVVQSHCRETSLFSDAAFASLQKKADTQMPDTEYVRVPAGVLLAYCVSRSWTFGSDWTGTNMLDPQSKCFHVLNVLCLVHYVIPGVVRAIEVSATPKYTQAHTRSLCIHACVFFGIKRVTA
jgi:hypothetical protein